MLTHTCKKKNKISSHIKLQIITYSVFRQFEKLLTGLKWKFHTVLFEFCHIHADSGLCIELVYLNDNALSITVVNDLK